MGEDGQGSLEPGIASGSEFVMSYPNKFLQYYYAANPNELPSGSAQQPVQVADVGAEAEADEVDEPEEPVAKKPKQPVEKAPIFNYLTFEKSRLEVGGPHHGKYTHVYKCVFAPATLPSFSTAHRKSVGTFSLHYLEPCSHHSAATSALAYNQLSSIYLLCRCNVVVNEELGQKCGCQLSMYSKGQHHVATSSNALRHFRHMAETKLCKVLHLLCTRADLVYFVPRAYIYWTACIKIVLSPHKLGAMSSQPSIPTPPILPLHSPPHPQALWDPRASLPPPHSPVPAPSCAVWPKPLLPGAYPPPNSEP